MKTENMLLNEAMDKLFALVAAAERVPFVDGERFGLSVGIMLRSIPFLTGAFYDVRDAARARGLEPYAAMKHAADAAGITPPDPYVIAPSSYGGSSLMTSDGQEPTRKSSLMSGRRATRRVTTRSRK